VLTEERNSTQNWESIRAKKRKLMLSSTAATQEAEIRKITVQNQPRQTVL
jgi:hypothetical protein